jgi:PHP domain
MLKGAIHIHSTYSDGEFSLAELREIYIAAGCQFVCMTDHAEYFDDERLQFYVNECAVISDEKIIFIPGLEFECERRMHVLGLNASQLLATTNPQEVIQGIEAMKAISVIAHPMDSCFDWIEKFEILPTGIEVWNSKYDGRSAPRPNTFNLLHRLQIRQPNMLAFYGQDLHWRTQYRELFIEVEAEQFEKNSILDALSSGNFRGVKSKLILPSNGQIPVELLEQFGQANRRTFAIRRRLKQIKKLADRLGIRFPTALKAQLRKVYQ